MQPSASGAAEASDTLTEQLAKMPDVVARLRAAHLPDDSGLHCRDCRGGAQRAAPRWPCNLRSLADAAQKLIDIRATAPRGR